MKTLNREQRIQELLAVFAGQIAMTNAVGYTDLNRAAQKVVCRLLQLAYDLPELVNLDDQNGGNYPAIDLADSTKRIGFQVTSDTTSKKLRETLQKAANSRTRDQISRIRFFLLVIAKPSFKANFSKDIPSGLEFELMEDVLDFTDLSTQLLSLTPKVQAEALHILELEFGEEGLATKELDLAELSELREVFVPPAQYAEAVELLNRRGLVIIAGVPHVGKTATAQILLADAREYEDNTRILSLKSRDAIQKLPMLEGELIFIDDAFGEFQFDAPDLANQSRMLLDAAKRNKIVVTTRTSVLKDAFLRTRLGEDRGLQGCGIELGQEGSYDTNALLQIYEKHLSLKLRKQPDLFDQETSTALRDQRRWIVSQLRFPHNIERFVAAINETYVSSQSISPLIQEAKHIALAAGNWFIGLDLSARYLVAVAALCPDAPTEAFWAGARASPSDSIDTATLVRTSGGFLRSGNPIQVAHPSYREGIIAKLQEEYWDEGALVLQQIASKLAPVRLSNVLPISLAWKQLNQKYNMFNRREIKTSLSDRDFFERMCQAYNDIIDHDLPNIRDWFEPYTGDPARIHLYRRNDGQLDQWTILTRHSALPNVTEDSGDDFTGRNPSKAEQAELDRGKLRRVIRRIEAPNTTDLPEVYAAQLISKQFKEQWRNDKTNAVGALMLHAELWSELKSGRFRVNTISSENPLTFELLLNLAAEASFTKVPTHDELQIMSQQIRDALAQGTVVVDRANINVCCYLLESLHDLNYTVTGPLLLEPDTSWQSPAVRAPFAMLESLYSDDRLREAVTHSLKLHYHALKEAVDYLIPDSDILFSTWWKSPFRIIGVIDRVPEYPERGATVIFDAEPCIGFGNDLEVFLAVRSPRQDDPANAASQCVLAGDKFPYRREYRSVDDCLDERKWLRRIREDLSKIIGNYVDSEAIRLYGFY